MSSGWKHLRLPSLSLPRSFSAPVDPPPPYILRPDIALPPTYDQTWESAKHDTNMPLIVRDTKASYETFKTFPIVDEPNWFQQLEADIDNPSEVLWPNTGCLFADADYSNKHWSLKLLRYRVVVPDGRIVLPMFAGMIVCEIIFTLFTPYPEHWPHGVDAISRITLWSPLQINLWFGARRDFESSAPDNLDSDRNTKAILHKSRTFSSAAIRNRAIRPGALDYLTRHAKIDRLQRDEDAFFYWLNHDLGRIAEANPPKTRKLYPLPASFALYGIVVGPHNWSINPLRELYDEIHARHRLRPEYESEQHFWPTPKSVLAHPDLPAYRLFVFNSVCDLATYVDHWQKGSILSYSSYHNITAVVYRPPLHGAQKFWVP